MDIGTVNVRTVDIGTADFGTMGIRTKRDSDDFKNGVLLGQCIYLIIQLNCRDVEVLVIHFMVRLIVKDRMTDWMTSWIRLIGHGD